MVVTTPEEVAQTFQEFYQDLYTHTWEDQQTQLGEDFLTSVSLPHLTDKQIGRINAPITNEQIEKIMQALPKNKSLGPYGLIADVFKILQADVEVSI